MMLYTIYIWIGEIFCYFEYGGFVWEICWCIYFGIREPFFLELFLRKCMYSDTALYGIGGIYSDTYSDTSQKNKYTNTSKYFVRNFISHARYSNREYF